MCPPAPGVGCNNQRRHIPNLSWVLVDMRRLRHLGKLPITANALIPSNKCDRQCKLTIFVVADSKRAGDTAIDITGNNNNAWVFVVVNLFLTDC